MNLLLLLTISHFFLLLGVHIVRSGQVINRIPYAVMMSVIPFLIVWPFARGHGHALDRVVIAYVVISVLTHVAQGILRQW